MSSIETFITGFLVICGLIIIATFTIGVVALAYNLIRWGGR